MSNSYINIIVEANVPYLKGVLDPYATVQYLPAEEITPEAARNADAMIIRTRTHADEGLLNRSKCRLVATATIGTDHINKAYCDMKGITVVNAPGCNAPAVAQYVFGSLMQVINRPIAAHTIAIIGLGNVGTIVERWARGFDMKVLRYDPPRQRAEGGDDWATLDRIASEADIITFHTPLARGGEDPTYHLLDVDFLGKLRRAPILINSARGEVWDTEAVVAAKDAGLAGPLIVDCWENEPKISGELLRRASVATPHIAGYSSEGKIRASLTVLDAVTTFFGLPRLTLEAPMPPAPARTVSIKGIVESFNPDEMTAALKTDPNAFEALRNNYKLRSEPSEGAES